MIIVLVAIVIVINSSSNNNSSSSSQAQIQTGFHCFTENGQIFGLLKFLQC